MSPAFPSFSTSSRRITFIGVPLPDLRCRERNQRHDAGLLDLHGQLALVGRAGPRNPARDDLSPLGDEVFEQIHVLVVDPEVLLRAEPAELLPHVSPSRAATGAASGPSLAGSRPRRATPPFSIASCT